MNFLHLKLAFFVLTFISIQLLSSHPPLAEGNVWKTLRRVLRPTCAGCAGICERKVRGRCQCQVDRVCMRNRFRNRHRGSRG
ncbi:Hypothetical predicted protein [Mytilus galloprovincialis]|uniref:Uncharacterized protein n=1 Tax=Mytilus galloprovincialis TaxID=29158 RepID=A0A8B6D3Q7_MYTGA|nr:Hypothetical predicted protein [Mytilus galloprovincialis]